MHRTASIVVAAGKGSRMGTDKKKQFVNLQGVPVLAHTLSLFENSELVTDIIVVVSEADQDYCRDLINNYRFHKVTSVVNGGKTRSESVYNGLKNVPEECNIVAVHDGARPFLSLETLHKALRTADENDSCLLAVKVKDTVKKAGENDFVESTLSRDKLWAVQTPQIFKKEILNTCYQKFFAEKDTIPVTDDASILEYYGYQVKIVEGEYFNIKITTPEDLTFAEAILRKRREENESWYWV